MRQHAVDACPLSCTCYHVRSAFLRQSRLTLPGRCYRLVINQGEAGPTHCPEPVAPRGSWRPRTAAATGSRPARATGRHRTRAAARPPSVAATCRGGRLSAGIPARSATRPRRPRARSSPHSQPRTRAPRRRGGAPGGERPRPRWVVATEGVRALGTRRTADGPSAVTSAVPPMPYWPSGGPRGLPRLALDPPSAATRTATWLAAGQVAPAACTTGSRRLPSRGGPRMGAAHTRPGPVTG
jgi:hypothetical protein